MMNKLLLILICIGFLLSCAACERKEKKTDPYYYSKQGIESDKEVADTLVNLGNTKEIENFLKGETFISKSSRLEFDDSLNVKMIVNGSLKSTYKCTVAIYILKAERLILLNDSLESKPARFTLAFDGTLTDMQSYSQYTPKEK